MVGLPLAENLFIIAFALVSFAFQVFVVTVGVLVAWRWLNRRGGAAMFGIRVPEKSALAILDERYARGEIDTAELEERRSRLMPRGSAA